MSEAEKLERIARLLEEIRDRQAESLALQRAQVDRAEKLQERATAIQDRSAQLVGRVQRFVPFAMAVVVILIGYVSWLLFRFYR